MERDTTLGQGKLIGLGFGLRIEVLNLKSSQATHPDQVD